MTKPSPGLRVLRHCQPFHFTTTKGRKVDTQWLCLILVQWNRPKQCCTEMTKKEKISSKGRGHTFLFCFSLNLFDLIVFIGIYIYITVYTQIHLPNIGVCKFVFLEVLLLIVGIYFLVTTYHFNCCCPSSPFFFPLFLFCKTRWTGWIHPPKCAVH